MSTTNPLFDKWRDWIKQIDDDQLQDLLINRHIFHQFRDSVNLPGDHLQALRADVQLPGAPVSLPHAPLEQPPPLKHVRHLDDTAPRQVEGCRKLALGTTLAQGYVPQQHRAPRVDPDVLDGPIPFARGEGADLRSEEGHTQTLMCLRVGSRGLSVRHFRQP